MRPRPVGVGQLDRAPPSSLSFHQGLLLLEHETLTMVDALGVFTKNGYFPWDGTRSQPRNVKHFEFCKYTLDTKPGVGRECKGAHAATERHGYTSATLKSTVSTNKQSRETKRKSVDVYPSPKQGTCLFRTLSCVPRSSWQSWKHLALRSSPQTSRFVQRSRERGALLRSPLLARSLFTCRSVCSTRNGAQG